MPARKPRRSSERRTPSISGSAKVTIRARFWLGQPGQKKPAKTSSKREHIFKSTGLSKPWPLAPREEKLRRLNEFMRILMKEGHEQNITVQEADDAILQSAKRKLDSNRPAAITKVEISALQKYYALLKKLGVSLPRITFKAKG